MVAGEQGSEAGIVRFDGIFDELFRRVFRFLHGIERVGSVRCHSETIGQILGHEFRFRRRGLCETQERSLSVGIQGWGRPSGRPPFSCTVYGLLRPDHWIVRCSWRLKPGETVFAHERGKECPLVERFKSTC